MTTKKHGFTLIELIVVMAILAILMAIGAGAFMSSMKKGRDSTRKANLRAITGAMELYYNDKGKYPVGVNGAIRGCGTDTVRTDCVAGGAFQDETPSPPTVYMQRLPTDPVDTQQYYYVSATGAQYQIYAHLENNQDPQCLLGDCTPASGVNCGTGILCNYGVSSANTSP